MLSDSCGLFGQIWHLLIRLFQQRVPSLHYRLHCNLPIEGISPNKGTHIVWRNPVLSQKPRVSIMDGVFNSKAPLESSDLQLSFQIVKYGLAKAPGILDSQNTVIANEPMTKHMYIPHSCFKIKRICWTQCPAFLIALTSTLNIFSATWDLGQSNSTLTC